MPKLYLNQKMKRALALVAAVLLSAFLAELLFFAAERAAHAGDYPETVYLSSDFTLFEMLEVPDANANRFETLANDSFFELTDIGGIRAKTIDFHLSREPNDTTEMVVRFSGKSDGVSGVFTAGIKKIEPGLYRAAANFDSLDSIRVYPTEKTGTAILFTGIKLNTAVSIPGISFYRLFLWAALFAGAIRLSFTAFNRKRNIKDARPWLSLYFYLSALVALFAFLAPRLFWSARQFGDILIPALLVLFTVFFLFIWYVSIKVKTFPAKVLYLFLLTGLIFTFATAPLQVPDEGIHFARSYAVAMGSFGFDGDQEYPSGVKLLYDVFTENLKMYEDQQGAPSAGARMREYLSHSGEDHIGEKDVFSNVQLILPYIPSAFGMLISRIFSSKALFALYAGRLMNVLMVAFAAYFAAGRAARYRTSLLVVIFSPLTMFMSASLSYDAMFLAALIVFLGFISADSLAKKDFVVMLAAFALMIMIKPLYLPLALLLFAIPKESFRFRGNYLVMVCLLFAAGVLCWQAALLYARIFARNIQPSIVLPGVDKAAQLSFILKNPLRFVTVAVVDGFRKSFYVGEFGLFGHLDLNAKLTGILSPAVIAVCFVLSAADPRKKRDRSGILFISLAVILYFALSAGFYVADSSLGGSTILGIQARYFTPCLFFVTAWAGNLFSRYLKPVKAGDKPVAPALWLCFSLALVASLEVFAGYYL